MSQRSISPTMRSPTPSPSHSHSSSCSRSLSWTHDASLTGWTTSSAKCRRDCSPSEQRHKRHHHDSPGKWIAHPFLPLVRHKNHCMTCNDYVQHIGIGAAVGGNGFSSTVDGLADCTTVFCGREPPQDLYAQVDHLRHQRDNLAHNLAATREEITHLSQGNLPHPTTTHDEAHQLKRARLASMGMPMSEGQPQAGPSRVTPATCSSVGRVQAEPAAAAPPTTTTTSSRKGKECQTSLCLPALSFHTRTTKWTIWSRALTPLTLFRELCSQNSRGKSLRLSYWETTATPRVFALSSLAWAIMSMRIKERRSPTL